MGLATLGAKEARKRCSEDTSKLIPFVGARQHNAVALFSCCSRHAPEKKQARNALRACHQRSVELILVSQSSIVVAVHLLPESLHIPVLCTSGGRKGGNDNDKRQGKKC